MKSYRKSQFDNLEKRNPNKSLFDLSHEFKTQICFGRYYPVLVEECLPGDEWLIDGEYQFRFPTAYFPLQQIATMRADYFYCPMKLLFKSEEDYASAQGGWIGFLMGEDVTLPVTDLNINGDGYAGSSTQQLYPGCSYPIENYMGFPYDTTARADEDKQMKVKRSAFPLAMYLFCYDEYYRNPLWEEPSFFNLDEGDNSGNFSGVGQVVDGQLLASWQPSGTGSVIINHPPFFAHYEKDYFTSARPEPQDGEAIKVPMLTEDGAPYDPQVVRVASDGSTGFDSGLAAENNGGESWLTTDAGVPVIIDQSDTAASIKQLRIAQVLQQFHERVMRIGKRYRGYIEGLWGNDPEPNAVDIPQLIGSHFGRIQVSDTLTTANTETGETGNYAGNLNFHNGGTSHRYYCQDYGLLMCIINVMPNTSYGQGMHPMWNREVNTDFALDMFAGIGDQEIKRGELLVPNIAAIYADPDEPWNATIGYQDRFAEYKTRVNRMFTTQDLYDSLYMGQKLSAVEENYDSVTVGPLTVGASLAPLTNGIREVDVFNSLPLKSGNSLYTDATIYAHFYFTLKVKRALPYFSTPGKMIF